MVDASSSVATNLDDFRRAAEGFAARLAPERSNQPDKIDDRVELLQDWTRAGFNCTGALARLEPGMFTRFNDALMLACRDQFGTSTSRRAVIVLTDGIDSGRGSNNTRGALQSLPKRKLRFYVVSNTEISEPRNDQSWTS